MQGCLFDIYIYISFYMCILFTHQLTQAACGDNHDKITKYEDHVQKQREKDNCCSLVWDLRTDSMRVNGCYDHRIAFKRMDKKKITSLLVCSVKGEKQTFRTCRPCPPLSQGCSDCTLFTPCQTKSSKSPFCQHSVGSSFIVLTWGEMSLSKQLNWKT